MFDVSEFKSIVTKRGIAKTNNYAVNITPPAQLVDPIINDLPFMVNSSNTPGSNFGTDPIRHKGYGLQELRPVQLDFEPITMTIIGDAKGHVAGFLQKWMSLVFNFDESSQRSTYQIPTEMFNYPDEYVGTIDLHLYDIASEVFSTYKLQRAYPVNMGAITLNWGETDNLMLIPVSFTYRSYSTDVTQSLAVTDSQINTLTGSNYRNVDQLQKMLTNPSLPDYQQRFLTV